MLRQVTVTCVNFTVRAGQVSIEGTMILRCLISESPHLKRKRQITSTFDSEAGLHAKLSERNKQNSGSNKQNSGRRYSLCLG